MTHPQYYSCNAYTCIIHTKPTSLYKKMQDKKNKLYKLSFIEHYHELLRLNFKRYKLNISLKTLIKISSDIK